MSSSQSVYIVLSNVFSSQKIRFEESNGPYWVQSAALVQGSINVPVTVNGQTSFQVPAAGRWSDDITITSFDLNTAVSFVVYYPGAMPWFPGYPPVADVPDATPSSPTPIYADAPITIPLYSDCSSLDNWETALNITISPAGQFYFNAIGEVDQNRSLLAQKWVPYEEYWVKAKLYFDHLGINSTSSNAVLTFEAHYFDWTVVFASDGLFNYVNYDDVEGVYICPVRCNGDAAWQEWLFKVSGATVEVFLKDTGESYFTSVGSFVVNYYRDNWVYVDGVPTEHMSEYYDDLSFSLEITTSIGGPTVTAHMDSLEILSTSDLLITDIISYATITVSNNALVLAGETLTINIGSTPIIYTFVSILTGADNEILIGSTADLTAANIASALYATAGAYFSATSASAVVSLTAYTSETVTMSTTSSGLTLGTVSRRITHRTSKAASSVPPFTGNSLSQDHGALGDVYHLADVPIITGSSTCSQPVFNIGTGSITGFTGYANSFLPGCTSASVDADKIALMLYGNPWMEWMASLIVVSDDDDFVALRSVKWVAAHIAYTTDLSLYGAAEYWADPRRTILNGAGDCEDFAFLTASLMLAGGVDTSRVRVYFGDYNNVGHAWVGYRRVSDEQWIILDATKG